MADPVTRAIPTPQRSPVRLNVRGIEGGSPAQPASGARSTADSSRLCRLGPEPQAQPQLRAQEPAREESFFSSLIPSFLRDAAPRSLTEGLAVPGASTDQAIQRCSDARQRIGEWVGSPNEFPATDDRPVGGDFDHRQAPRNRREALQRHEELRDSSLVPEAILDRARRVPDGRTPQTDDQYARDELTTYQKAVADARARKADAQDPRPIPQVVPPEREQVGPVNVNRDAIRPVVPRGEVGPTQRNLLALNYSVGASGADNKWGTGSFEGYRDFVENAVRSGRLDAAKMNDWGSVQALLREQGASPNADGALRASDAQATIAGNLKPGRGNKPEDVARVHQALAARGYNVDAGEVSRREFGRTSQAALRLFTAAMRGVPSTGTARPGLSSGDPIARALFSNEKDTPHLWRATHDLRWSELSVQGRADMTLHASYLEAAERRNGGHQWGTQRLVDVIGSAAQDFSRRFPGQSIEVNDMSRRDGGHLNPHAGHQTGLEADITHGGAPSRRDFRSTADHRAAVQAWQRGVYERFRSFAQQDNVNFIYSSNSSFLRQMARAESAPWANKIVPIGGHSTHFHVTVNDWTTAPHAARPGHTCAHCRA